MTGYGNEIKELDHALIKVEIRSVNHRFLDMKAKIPSSIMFLEDRLKQVMKQYFNRGRTELYISWEGDLLVERTLHTDWKLMDEFLKQLKEAKHRYQLSGDIPISVIATIPDLITVIEKEQQPTHFEDLLLESTRNVCEKVRKMREEEGSFLINDIKKRLTSIENMVSLVEGRRIHVIDEYRERIEKRIETYMNDSMNMDERIRQEIALLAEKGDITEEIIRLKSHLNHFYELIPLNDPVGRKMDFIVQEMHREINTIGSKSSDSMIGQWTVNLKSEVEKIKEQVQNIE